LLVACLGCYLCRPSESYVHVGFEPGVERGVRAIAAGLGSACEGLCGYLPTH
jgi:hypothetical protein